MIRIFQAQKIAFDKIRFKKGKSLFVILPICLMVAIIVFISSESLSLINVAHNNIFSPIEGQNEVLEVTKTTDMRDMMEGNTDTGYTSTDIETVTAITNVEKASLISVLPIDNINTSDLFENVNISISSLAGLDEEYASLYTNESFSYTEGNAIPIILNANDFIENYEEWNGQTEITVSFTQNNAGTSTEETTDTTGTTESENPIRTRALTYSRDDLIGKTITVSFGGLDDIEDYTREASTDGFTFKQKTEDEYNTEVETRKTAISQYWDYDKISTPLTYTFVVVGISEGTDKTMAYIPSEFASVLLKDYLSLSINARNTTAIPEDDQNSTFAGLTYDGVSLQSDSVSNLFARMRSQVNEQVREQFSQVNEQINEQNASVNNQISNMQGQGQRMTPPNFTEISNMDASSVKISFPGESTGYNIPGLVYAKDRTTSEVTGEYTSFDFTQTIPLTSSTLLVKLTGVDSRTQVITDLNSQGYRYQDFSNYEEYEKLESYLSSAIKIVSIVFMVISALFVLLNMAKFVSESRKEIGIFRAIGASKGDIRMMFILQSLVYVVLSILLGFGIGTLAVFGLSGTMVTYAQQVINSAVGSTVTLSQAIVQSDFFSFDWSIILIYSGLLLVVTLIVSLIPSGQAARVSPVEAIRNS